MPSSNQVDGLPPPLHWCALQVPSREHRCPAFLSFPLFCFAKALLCQSCIQPNLTESNSVQIYTRAANPRTGTQRACVEEYDHPHGHRMFYIPRGWPFGQPRHDQFPLQLVGPAVLGGPLAFQLSSGFACLLCWKNCVVCCFFLTTGVEQHRGLISHSFSYLVDEPT